VRTGDWEPLVAHFADDATLEFVGVPAGPFHGRDGIEAAYRAQPPDDEIDVVEAHEQGDTVVAPFTWRSTGDAGEMRLTHDGAEITRLVVSFG
jgi:steroid Delta-isomerase